MNTDLYVNHIILLEAISNSIAQPERKSYYLIIKLPQIDARGNICMEPMCIFFNINAIFKIHKTF